jgi:hypothetical protein
MAISIPLYFLFIPYVIFLAMFGFYSFFNCLQLFKHGVKGTQSEIILFIFLLGVGIILLASITQIGAIDWNQPLLFSLQNGTL